jgi:hypothetical protein
LTQLFHTGELFEAVRGCQTQPLPNEQFESIQPSPNSTMMMGDALMKSVDLMIDNIASLVVCDYQRGVRDSAINLLNNLAGSGGEEYASNLRQDNPPDRLKKMVITKISASIESGLKNRDSRSRMQTIGFLRAAYKKCK